MEISQNFVAFSEYMNFKAYLLIFVKAIFVPSMWPWNKSEEMLLEYKNFMKIYATFSMCKLEGAIKEL